MGTTDDAVKHEGGARAAELERGIAETRAEMGETIAALHGKLNPTVLKEQAVEQFQQAKDIVKAEVKEQFEDAKERVRHEIQDAKQQVRDATIGRVEHMVERAGHTVTDTGNSIFETIRENPIPAALVGLGLAWMFTNRKSGRGARLRSHREDFAYGYPLRREAGHDEYGVRTGGALHQGGGALHQVQEGASHLAHRVGDAAGSLAHSVQGAAGHAQDAASSFVDSAQEGIHHFADQARVQAHRIEDRVGQTLRANPLAVAAGALALGTAVGLMLPSTEREDEWVGAARDQVVDRARDLAQGAIGKVEEQAKHLTSNASA